MARADRGGRVLNIRPSLRMSIDASSKQEEGGRHLGLVVEKLDQYDIMSARR